MIRNLLAYENTHVQKQEYLQESPTRKDYLSIVQEMNDAIADGLLQLDPNNSNNILVYRFIGKETKEGWYSENILTVASELKNSKASYQAFHNALSDAKAEQIQSESRNDIDLD